MVTHMARGSSWTVPASLLNSLTQFSLHILQIFHSSQMADMHTSPSYLPPLGVVVGWRNRHLPTKKWQCPCGKVLPTEQTA